MILNLLVLFVGVLLLLALAAGLLAAGWFARGFYDGHDAQLVRDARRESERQAKLDDLVAALVARQAQAPPPPPG